MTVGRATASKMLACSIVVAFAVPGMLATSAAASPTANTSAAFQNATMDDSFAAWGQFCNDLSCSDCGIWVDLSNSDCLQETDRQAINIKSNGPDAFVAVVYTPDHECNCQSECDAIAGIGCWQLNATRAAETQSYRFVNFGDFGSVCSNTVTSC